MIGLREHAERELKIANVDADIYGDEVPKAVLELIDVFASQGHSGASADLVLSIFEVVARYRPLTPLTDHPLEWHFHGEDVWGKEGGVWQNKRDSSAFSTDGGKTYHYVNDKDRTIHQSKKASEN